jgi:hypothetical protein
VTVERAHIDHLTRYTVRDGAALRCDLVFDTGEAGIGPAEWKILLPGPEGTEQLYGVHRFMRPDAAQLTNWLTPIVGPDAAAELAEAVDANPPHDADWQRPAGQAQP